MITRIFFKQLSIFFFFFSLSLSLSLCFSLRVQYIYWIWIVCDCELRFEIKTPLRTFNLQAKHDVAVEEWINHINKFRTKKTKRTHEIINWYFLFFFFSLLSLSLLFGVVVPWDTNTVCLFSNIHLLEYFAKEELKAVDNRGYHYSKPLEGRIILILQSGPEGIGSSSSSKTKKWKPKGSVITIGRSSTNTIQIEDKYVSRNHAKIEVLIQNTLYFCSIDPNTHTHTHNHTITQSHYHTITITIWQ
jgi:hypothetical protein